MHSNQHYKNDEEKFEVLLQNTPEEEYPNLINECAEVFFTQLPSVSSRIKILRRITKNFVQRQRVGAEMFELSEVEIATCNSIDDPLLKRVFYCLLVQRRLHPHKNGWVELDWPKVLTTAFDPKEAQRIKIEILSELRPYGLNMRVIGSQNPILCFCLDTPIGGETVCSLPRQEALKYFEKEIAT